MNIMDIQYEDFTYETLKTYKVKNLKEFIKEFKAKLVNKVSAKRKDDYINYLISNKEYIFGKEEVPLPVPKAKAKVKKVRKPRKAKIVTEEKTTCFDPDMNVVGVDECGAGCFSGDLYVGACIMPATCPTPDDEEKLSMWNSIQDSKKVSKKQLPLIFDYIKEVAIEWSVIQVGPEVIDEINIRQARLKGFHLAINEIKDFDHIAVDGDIFNPYYDNMNIQIPHTTVTKGDTKFRCIAAASILAKVSRDRAMVILSEEHPEYGWNTNVGYGTAVHIAAIKEHGLTPYHRKTFGICRQYS